jgi:hypothetical protein
MSMSEQHKYNLMIDTISVLFVNLLIIV